MLDLINANDYLMQFFLRILVSSLKKKKPITLRPQPKIIFNFEIQIVKGNKKKLRMKQEIVIVLQF